MRRLRAPGYTPDDVHDREGAVSDPNRREALGRLAAAAALLAVGCDDDAGEKCLTPTTYDDGAALGRPTLSADPFSLGVASGDPLPDAVVIWTRLAPDPLAEGGAGGMPPEAVAVEWTIAEDEAMTRVVQRGVAAARPERGHAVHVDVGCLAPATTYYYRFGYGDRQSPVGRTRTAPALDSSPEALTLAVASCQDYRDGYYTSQRNLAAEELDVVLFVGDYIYEQGPGQPGVREHIGPEPRTLAEYRRRYALYKLDPNLQAAHAAHPWIATWDDHEVDGNYTGDSGQEDVDRAAFLARRAAAYRAWQEHLPVRLAEVDDTAEEALRIYRAFDYGDLMRLSVLDTRQYRDPHACESDGFSFKCDEWNGYDGAFMGAAQEAWLAETLRGSTARWNAIAQQVVMTSTLLLDGRLGNNDQWDGYPEAQQRMRDLLAETADAIVLTGDLHAGGVGRLTAQIDDPDSPQVAVEFLGTSLTSRNSTQEDPRAAGRLQGFVLDLPQIEYFDLTRRGYLVCRVERDRWEAQFRVVDTVDEETSGTSTAATFEVERGTGTLRRLDEPPAE